MIRRPPRSTRIDTLFPTRRSSDLCLTVAAQPVEINLMEHDRAGAVQLLALEAAIDHRRQVRVGERGGKPCLDHVQSLDRAGIIVLVVRSEEHTSELQSLMRISYAVFCLKKKINKKNITNIQVNVCTQNKNKQHKIANIEHDN